MKNFILTITFLVAFACFMFGMIVGIWEGPMTKFVSLRVAMVLMLSSFLLFYYFFVNLYYESGKSSRNLR